MVKKTSRSRNVGGASSNQVGVWLFYAGIIIVVAASLLVQGPLPLMWAWTIGGMGLIIGLVNVTSKEVGAYLLAAIAFVLASSALNATGFFSQATFLARFFNGIVLLVSPGVLVVALKALYDISKS